MKATELREMAIGEIKAKEAELQKEMFNLGCVMPPTSLKIP